jgi:hypothetical protein
MSTRTRNAYKTLLPSLLLLSFAAENGLQRSTRPPGPNPPPLRSGVFEIVSCSLGCAAGTNVITCGTVDIHVNEVLRITFNQPVALTSVNNNSFRMIEVQTGRTPPAVFALDPADPNTLVYRPQMAFDSGGNPLFGLLEDRVYLLVVPGVEQDPLGPFVTSLSGAPNQRRMQCTLVTSLGVTDSVPGRPRAKIYVQAVLERDPVSGEPIRTAPVPAEGATDVLRASPIEIVFDDVMNPATIANPVTGRSDFIRVRFDPDGNVQNASDQVPVPGLFTLTIDQARSVTRAVFRAEGGLPAAGPQRNPGRVVVDLSPQIQDLGGNALVNPGRTVFTTEAR